MLLLSDFETTFAQKLNIKEGQKCETLNRKVTVGESTYRCTKFGKAKFWAKIKVTTTTPAKVVTVPQPFGDGTFKVGTEIAPGRYMSVGKICSYEIVTNNPAEFPIKYSGGVRNILDILATDVSLTSRGCNQWTPLTSYTTVGSPSEGDWLVGLEFPSGTWQSLEPNCIWFRKGEFRGIKNINTNLFDIRQGGTLVRVLPTDVGLNSYKCGVWVKVG
jgi:hypothetical protein